MKPTDSISIADFTRNLVAALGGDCTMAESGIGNVGNFTFTGETIPNCPLTGKLRVSVWDGKGQDKAELRVYPEGIPHEFSAGRCYPEAETTLPEMTVTRTRPVEAIVREVHRRLFEPAAGPIAKRRKRAAEAAEHNDATGRSADAIRAACPMVKVERAPHSDRTTIYLNESGKRSGAYIQGSISGATVSIERMGSMSIPQFTGVVRALTTDVPPLAFEDWDLIRTALHMAAGAYAKSYTDMHGNGDDTARDEADRCARQEAAITDLLPRVETVVREMQATMLLARAASENR